MKGFIFTLTVFILFGSSHSALHAQAGKFSTGISMSYGGFSLEGNANGSELLVPHRKTNSTEASIIGAGLMLEYGILDNLDATYHWHYEYGNEELVETYALVIHDLGVRYYIVNKGLSPYVKGGITKYTLNDLKLVDPAVTSQVKIREYDFSGTGLSYGVGLALSAGKTLTYLLEYTITSTFAFDKKEGSIDFDNKPSLSRLSFAFTVTF